MHGLVITNMEKERDTETEIPISPDTDDKL